MGVEGLKRELSDLSVQLAPVVSFAVLTFPSLRLVLGVVERFIIHFG